MHEQSYRIFEFDIKENDAKVRIDKYLTDNLEDQTRSYIQKLIKEDLIFVNDQNVKANYKLRLNDHIAVNIPPSEIIEVKPEDIPLDIIYEDEDLVLINKGQGMVVHPSNGHYSGTLVNGLLYRYKDGLSTINGNLRPGIVHRLDMDTTGILIVCKNDIAHLSIAKQLKEHKVKRTYNAIVYNSFNNTHGIIDAPIGRHPIERTRMSINYENGKHAITHYKLIENLKNNFAYVECDLETGRTHQIRVHMESISHPILGDRIYGPKNKKYKLLYGQVLHARFVGFVHPTKHEYMEFEAPLPEYFMKLLKTLRV